MDRDRLLGEIRTGPVRVHMNDGTSFLIPSREVALVDQIAASVLYKADAGIWRTHVLSLVCMTRIERMTPESLVDTNG